MKKRIGMVLDKGFPPDIRVEKEAKALIQGGFEVFLLCEKSGSNQKDFETLDYGLHVSRFAYYRDKLANFFEKVTMQYRGYHHAISHFIENFRLDAIHIHDFDMVPTGLRVARKYHLPIVADLHENLPAAFVAYRSDADAFDWLYSHATRNYLLMRWHEKRALKGCDRIIVVVPEAFKRMVNEYGIAREKIEVVSNTEDETTSDASAIDEEIVRRYQGQWPILYIGGIGPHRGIDTAIRAAVFAGRKIPGFKLLLVGLRHDKDRSQIKKLVRKTQTEKYVELTDWVPSAKVNSFIAASRACLVPHNDFEHTHTTVPHKLFQYMMLKKPVVVSSCRPLKRIVEETESGMVFSVNRPEDMARCLVHLHENPSDAAVMGENGYRSAAGKYSWKNDSSRLVGLYKNLFSNPC